MTDSLSSRLEAAIGGVDLHRSDAARNALLASLTPTQRSLISVASIGFRTSPSDLAAITERVWGFIADEDDLRVLAALPLIETEANGWAVATDAADAISDAFRESEPAKFTAAHQAFADLEAEHKSQISSEYDGWFVDSRIAYFLAGFDPAASVAAFDERFATPPEVDRVSARMWLTSLVLKQSALLDGYERDLVFYRGFRAYVSGARSEARDDFQLVADEPRDDHITAIAEHLLAVLLREADLEKAIEYCRASIRRSDALDFSLNQVMATNTLIWMLLRRTDRNPEFRDTRDATRLADRNLDSARALGDRVLVDRCRNTRVTARWEAARDEYRQTEDPLLIREVEALLAELGDLIETGEPEIALFSAAKSGEIRYWIGEYDAAIEVIDNALSNRTASLPALASAPMLEVAGNVEQHFLATDETRRRARSVKDTLTGLGYRARRRRQHSEDRELSLT